MDVVKIRNTFINVDKILGGEVVQVNKNDYEKFDISIQLYAVVLLLENGVRIGVVGAASKEIGEEYLCEILRYFRNERYDLGVKGFDLVQYMDTIYGKRAYYSKKLPQTFIYSWMEI